MRTAVLLSMLLLAALPGWAESPQNEVRAVLTAFSDSLRDRNIAHVQKTVGGDLVAILDGVRYDGWESVRDRALIPEFARPAPPANWQIVNISATGDMAWAYARTSLAAKNRTETTVWTVYALERRGKEWKIVLVDRSTGHPQPAKKGRAH